MVWLIFVKWLFCYSDMVKFMVSFKRMVRIVENDENFSIVNLNFKVFVFIL